MAARLIPRVFSAGLAPRASFQFAHATARSQFLSMRAIATKKYTPEHEWVLYDDATKIGTISITDYAQKALGDVVFVELPAIGTELAQGDNIGAVESVKAASDIYAPISGKIIEVNKGLDDKPGLLNADPEGEGWLCKIEASKPEEIDSLLDEAAYKQLCEEGHQE
ncbi:Glycine cleavage system H protein {ECO:0000255/HAMAP-Rule:MF_00272} [Serendipita indica DSM 11827]|uniref:Glycine cleavage system H protein n=1 Tax=Serendipita indica (strain DSM 11827) TaxID=1109443 RepID=G4TSS6_SERID|nr:Glycine cleavage system H protein {ECO:0000255/HAMAP-Rule:MF_00272} [Serendipita indica DSM 11827]CCA74369.1 probable Glycine cleavage system H protein, mitochondrial precursor [Serendipita indica DSM 11827]